MIGEIFNPRRLTLARKLRALTKVALAKVSGFALRTLIAYEANDRVPTEENIQVLAKCLRVPRSFFFGLDLEEPSPEGASFRALTNMTAAQRDASLAVGALAIHFSKWIDASFDLPTANVPSLRGHDPETAARMLRADWKLGEQPIKNVVHLLEMHGVRVFALPIESLAVDAFSVWVGARPFVFLNSRKSAEHSRFDGAHELGHLCLHQHGGSRGREVELEAHRFASAFLMPHGSVISRAPRVPTLRALIQLKRQWTVSVAALAHRLHSVEMLSDYHYRRLCIEIAQAGYHRNEPAGVARETSQVLTKVLAAMRDEGTTRKEIAHALGIFTDDLDALMFGLVPLSPIQGGSPTKGRGSASLRPVAGTGA